MPPAARSRAVFHCASASSASRCTTRKATSHAPSPLCRPLRGLERQEAGGEAGPERRQHRRSAQASLERAIEHEQHARRRHVAMAAQHLTLITQGACLQLEGRLHRIEHLGAAGMADEPRRLQPRLFHETADRGNLRGIHDANDAFHLALFSACGNPYLVESLQNYMNLTLPMRAKNLADREGLQISRRQHDLMIELLKGRDSWALAQLCVEHMQYSKSDYLNRIAADK